MYSRDVDDTFMDPLESYFGVKHQSRLLLGAYTVNLTVPFFVICIVHGITYIVLMKTSVCLVLNILYGKYFVNSDKKICGWILEIRIWTNYHD